MFYTFQVERGFIIVQMATLFEQVPFVLQAAVDGMSKGAAGVGATAAVTAPLGLFALCVILSSLNMENTRAHVCALWRVVHPSLAIFTQTLLSIPFVNTPSLCCTYSGTGSAVPSP
jgi:hypothetical protein